MKLSLATVAPTPTCISLFQFSILLLAVGFLLRQFEYFAIASAIVSYLVLLALRFHRRMAVMKSKLTVTRTLENARGFVGSKIGVDLRTSNSTNANLIIKQVDEKMYLNGDEKTHSLPGTVLKPSQTTTLHYEIEFENAGVLEFRSAMLRMVDDRHLFESILNFELPARLQVDPRRVTGLREITPIQLYGGALERKRITSVGLDFASTKAYELGDDLKRIEWKASARHQKLMVKQFHAESGGIVVVLLDGRRNMFERGFVASRFEEALTIAELVGQVAYESGNPFGFGILREHKLGTHWLPDTRRFRLEQIRSIARARKGLPPYWVVPEPYEPVTPRTLGRQIRNLESFSSSQHLSRLISLLAKTRLFVLGRLRNSVTYKALKFYCDSLTQQGLILVLTDLRGELEPLLEGLRYSISRGHKAMVVQIASPWRLEEDLEMAYVKYEANQRIIDRFREEGIPILDTKPQRLLGTLRREMMFETR